MAVRKTQREKILDAIKAVSGLDEREFCAFALELAIQRGDRELEALARVRIAPLEPVSSSEKSAVSGVHRG